MGPARARDVTPGGAEVGHAHYERVESETAVRYLAKEKDKERGGSSAVKLALELAPQLMKYLSATVYTDERSRSAEKQRVRPSPSWLIENQAPLRYHPLKQLFDSCVDWCLDNSHQESRPNSLRQYP
ncbi:hypothetical protein SO802_025681 [Lithocarpus litseifolius]|uniref:Uncharacterized protein n=1 Tax=Lithocarpus litseifolius TaxID=425828 RepID=A0AAW2BXS9_9ROSI